MDHARERILEGLRGSTRTNEKLGSPQRPWKPPSLYPSDGSLCCDHMARELYCPLARVGSLVAALVERCQASICHLEKTQHIRNMRAEGFVTMFLAIFFTFSCRIIWAERESDEEGGMNVVVLGAPHVMDIDQRSISRGHQAIVPCLRD